MRVRGQVGVGPGHEEFRPLGRPGMVGRNVVGDEVQDQPDTAVGQRLPGSGQAGRTAEVIVDDVVADAVRRPDDIAWAPIGQGGPERSSQIGVRQGDLDAGRAALPDAHQPDRVEPQIGELVPVPGRHGTQVDRCALPPS